MLVRRRGVAGRRAGLWRPLSATPGPGGSPGRDGPGATGAPVLPRRVGTVRDGRACCRGRLSPYSASGFTCDFCVWFLVFFLLSPQCSGRLRRGGGGGKADEGRVPRRRKAACGTRGRSPSSAGSSLVSRACCPALLRGVLCRIWGR